ncbi:hypothetical protein NQ314_021022 [Rhamnusium bicolor]|uniref:Uncharacterized protein n=1 Tax=Rhamnusium bicolor TaxID=1586634 RepID=A0AAV8WJG7_9CUCU|nr:hypothetical protein NQ314_021022 [Rhamnusium bicolor]
MNECGFVRNQFLSSYFLIKEPNGKNRFILNLKKLNSFILVSHFKLEDYRTVLNFLSRDCFIAKLYLQDAYFLLPIDKKYRKYLKFKFANKLCELWYTFRVKHSPVYFHKVNEKSR